MIDDEPLVHRLPARSPRDILCTLVGARTASGELPRITAHLRSGRELHGQPLAVDLDAGSPSLLLRAVTEDLPEPLPHVIYVDLTAIEAVTVHEVDGLAGVLAPGLEVADEPAPPDRLALEKLLVRARDAVAFASDTPMIWELPESLPDDDGATLATLSAALQLTRRALVSISREDWGRRSIARRLQRVLFRLGEAPCLRVAGDSLLVDCAPGAPCPPLVEWIRDLEAELR